MVIAQNLGWWRHHLGLIQRGAKTRLAKFKILVYFDEMVGISDIFISKEVRQVWWACNRQLQWFIPSRHLEKLWPWVYSNTIGPGPRVIRTLDPSEIGPQAQRRLGAGVQIWLRPGPKLDFALGPTISKIKKSGVQTCLLVLFLMIVLYFVDKNALMAWYTIQFLDTIHWIQFLDPIKCTWYIIQFSDPRWWA